MPRVVFQPALRFAKVEAAGGIAMLAAALVALVWANSPWDGAYERFVTTPVSLHLGSLVNLDLDLQAVVNDGLMTLFFLVAGLEIKRQLVAGELSDRRAAALPALAAVGGMVVPALIYVLLNAGHPGAEGWGIPVATDIAFAVGIVTLVGRRVPVGARVLILTLAVVDDVGGILVIAVFYADNVTPAWLALAAVSVVATLLLLRGNVRSLVPYLCLGALCWYSLHEAGVEAAIAGVVFGLLTPVRPFYDPAQFGEVAHRLVDEIEQTNETATEDLSRYARETESPVERIENRLNLWVAFLIVPLFALTNAGVRLDMSGLDRRVLAGVAVGLVVGKAVGVFGASWLAIRLGIGRLPASTTWRQMFGLAVTAGIGFTVALFVTGLSFTDPSLTASAKIGVLLGSVVAGTVGFLLLRTARAAREVDAELRQ